MSRACFSIPWSNSRLLKTLIPDCPPDFDFSHQLQNILMKFSLTQRYRVESRDILDIDQTGLVGLSFLYFWISVPDSKKIPALKETYLVPDPTHLLDPGPGLQKMFSLSGTIKSNGQNFLSNMCTKHTSQAHSVKFLWAGFRPRAFWRSLVQSAPIFEPFLCKYYYFLVLVLNIFCGVNFFSGTGGPTVLWIL